MLTVSESRCTRHLSALQSVLLLLQAKSLADSIIGKLDSKLEVLSSRLTRMVLTVKAIFEVGSGAASPRKEERGVRTVNLYRSRRPCVMSIADVSFHEYRPLTRCPRPISRFLNLYFWQSRTLGVLCVSPAKVCPPVFPLPHSTSQAPSLEEHTEG
jgi:hypothetical protein